MKAKMDSILRWFIIPSVFAVFALSACTKKAESPAPTAENSADTAPAATTSAENDQSKKIDVELKLGSDGDNLYFDHKDLQAKAGQTIKVVYKNNSSAASNMVHNWVLVKPGTEQQVANDSMSAGDAKNWVAEGANVLAHTKVAKSGEIVSIIFTAPAAGDYPYLCTFPGHATTMKGTLHIK